MSAEAITISREQIDALIRAEAQRLVADRIAAAPLTELVPKLNWRPAEWFAKEWGKEPETAHAMLRKARVKVWKFSQKGKLYSVTDANEKAAALATVSGPRRRRSKIIQLAQAS